MMYEAIPDELKSRTQWCLTWLKDEDGIKKKIPVSAVKGCKVSPTDSATWSLFSDCEERLSNDKYRPCLATGEGIVAIDLDKCIDEERLSKLAENVVGAFQDCYVEKSVSGRGLHILCKCRTHIENVKTKDIEVYGHDHFITVTGKSNGITEIKDKTEEILKLVEWLNSRKKKDKSERQQKSFSCNSTLTDDEVLEKAKASRNGRRFTALFDGLWENENIGDGSQSCADLALCASLAFFCRCDKEQMTRLFEQSGLYRNARKTKNAVEAAIKGCTKVYGER